MLFLAAQLRDATMANFCENRVMLVVALAEMPEERVTRGTAIDSILEDVTSTCDEARPARPSHYNPIPRKDVRILQGYARNRADSPLPIRR